MLHNFGAKNEIEWAGFNDTLDVTVNRCDKVNIAIGVLRVKTEICQSLRFNQCAKRLAAASDIENSKVRIVRRQR